MNMLDVTHLSISFGGLKAVDDFHINVKKGQLYGLIGPNGAGKTTIFNLLTGVYKPNAGSIVLNGNNITGKRSIDINKAGIARTFQNIRLFKQLSVLDNVKLGLHNDYKYSLADGIFRLPSYFKTEKQMNEKAEELLAVFGLADEKDFISANLPYGKQRKLEIARALATSPKLLLLDEPFTALDNELKEEIRALVLELHKKFRTTTVLVTHDRQEAFAMADRIAVMRDGRVMRQGARDEMAAYLGNKEGEA